MKLALISKSNENCYLYSVLQLESEYICDTLEIGTRICISAGFYTVCLRADPQTKDSVMQIIDENGKEVSSFVKDICIFAQNIKIRKLTPNICIGTKILTPMLVMNDYIFKLLLLKIRGAIHSGESITLEVVSNAIRLSSLSNEIEYVTNY
jgi:hypothetical protein